MALYLVQHGKSLSKDLDPEKGLSEAGTTEVQRIAQVARGYDVQVGEIIHSGKKRARQTAEILASALAPRRGVREAAGMNPLDDVVDFAVDLDSAADIMLVGHLPFLSRLTSYLITGSIDTPVFKFQNGGILCLTSEEGASGYVIQWALMPHIGQ